MRPHFTSEIRQTDTLSDELKQRMYGLFQTYYCDVTETLFLNDLREKNYILLFWEKGAAEPLVGFSTLCVREENARTVSIFSGDTVLHEKCWGSRILQKAFSVFIARTKFRYPTRSVYWMLMSKGYKTYLLVRKNFPVSYPNYRTSAPTEVLALKNNFYRGKYGAAFDPTTSIIRFSEAHGAVKDDIAIPSEESVQGNPDIGFFVRSNPGYQIGDEFACIAEIRLWDIAYTSLKYVTASIARKKNKK